MNTEANHVGVDAQGKAVPEVVSLREAKEDAENRAVRLEMHLRWATKHLDNLFKATISAETASRFAFKEFRYGKMTKARFVASLVDILAGAQPCHQDRMGIHFGLRAIEEELGLGGDAPEEEGE